MTEEWLRSLVFYLVRLVEITGALIIFSGTALTFVRVVIAIIRQDQSRFVGIRLNLGRFLALGLEFQLASDLLRTAVAPTFDEIGKLAAVAAIRTVLNFFLAKEISQERQELEKV